MTGSANNLHPVADKLDRSNHPTWHTQVIATIRGARLEEYLIRKKQNLEE